ncbi:hypothetical protein Taro_024688 [Colocasia esculenta]|uniref:Glabrous enhancer-binding protein-like DBD domain-containing protein n=1 Tax=Colocasia esculenta TaxID=4460 RepID=A0A843VC06_COLES|nr:hypothetical protein [Colocasia esculenta]
MDRPKAMPPPSPSSSGSESETSTSSSDEEEQQKQQLKEAARAKASAYPVKKKPVVVPKQQQNMEPQGQMASPPPAKKKSVLKNNKKPPPPVPRSDAAAVHSSSSDEEASDSPPKAKPTPSPSRPRNLKPSTSSKPEVPTPAASQQSHEAKGRKRQREEAGDKQEGDAAAVGGSSSKKLFQRVWTDEDEIALLEGMLDFQEKHGGPLRVSVSNALFEFISSTLERDFSKVQLYTKIRALRKKYERNLLRGKEGADPSFSKPHEQVAFELSKKLWPTAEGDAHDYRGNGTSVDPKDREKKMGHQGAGPLYPSLTEAISLLGKEDDNSFLSQTASRALESLKSTKAKALEDRWSKHFIAGANYFMERARLKKDLEADTVGPYKTEQSDRQEEEKSCDYSTLPWMKASKHRKCT